MLVPTNAAERIASKIDIRLCGMCGWLRMTDDDKLREETTSLVTYKLNELRTLVGDLAANNREGYTALEQRMTEQHADLSKRLYAVELKIAHDTGALAGIKTFIALLISATTALGGVIGWMISYFTNKK